MIFPSFFGNEKYTYIEVREEKYFSSFHRTIESMYDMVSLKDSQTSLTLFFALFSKLIVYKYIKFILHHVQKLKSYLCQKC